MKSMPTSSNGRRKVPDKGKVSIIIRTYNSGKFVRDAIESALRQDISSSLYEILVVDDGSTDNTREILKSYGNKIRVIEQAHKGNVNAANRGIAVASGGYIILLDADDTFEPTIISEMINILENESEVSFVYCDYYQKDMGTGAIKVIALRDNIFNSVAEGIAFRKTVLEEVGMYDESLIFPEYDLLIKIIKEYKGRHIPKPLFTYVRHKGSITSNKKLARKGREQIYKKHKMNLSIRDY